MPHQRNPHPFDRLCHSRVLTKTQEMELLQYRDGLNPAQIGRDIDHLQRRLAALAAEKTRVLETAAALKLPDTNAGVELRDAG